MRAVGFPADAMRRPATTRCGAASAPGTASRSFPQQRADPHPHRPARRSGRQTEPLYRGRDRGILIGCLYLPNGNPQPGPKFEYKLKWFSRLRAHAKKLMAQKVPLVLAGDFNVAPTEVDIYETKSWDDDALIQPESRAAFRKLVDLGFTDALRELHPDARIYTFWHYMRKRWERMPGCGSIICCSRRPQTPADSGGRRPRRARRARRQRPRAGVGGAEGGPTEITLTTPLPFDPHGEERHASRVYPTCAMLRLISGEPEISARLEP